ncbi:DNA helicase [Planctomycetales bacterium]|nr:DNA helicase [Planctomycetales bacterium]
MHNTIIKASAGTGKTYKLSNRYIGILFNKVFPETILASTFTRKAAGEILERILTRLADAALNNEKHAELDKALQDDGLPKCLAPAALQSLVAGTARKLYQLRITTLDSLFNKMAAAFTFELGLPPGWTMLEDADTTRVITEAVQNVLDGSKRNDAKKLLHLLHHGDQRTLITDELVKLAKEYIPLSRETKNSPDIWGKGLTKKTLIADEEFNRVFKNFLNVPLPVKETGKGAGAVPERIINDHEKIRVAVENSDWKQLWNITLFNNTLAGKKAHYVEIDGELKDCILAIHDQAVAVETDKLLGLTEATGKLLALITEAYDDILYRGCGYRFDDITHLLSSAHLDMNVLSHRLDANTEHILLDEFQDTSLPQWNVLQPLTNNAAKAKTGSAFFVGDLKQAIYAWRGGVAEIFDSVEKLLPGINTEPLDKSYRSSPVIIDTVNTIFEKIVTNAALQDDNYLDAAVQWSKRFKQHEPAKDYGGYSVLETVDIEAPPENDNGDEGDDNAEASDPFTDYVIKRIAEIHQKRPEAEIGVLVLRNAKIGGIVSGLKTKYGITASEEGGVPLTDSNAVQFVLSAMKLADHPGDTAARYHLTLGPLGAYIGLTEYNDNLQAVTASKSIRHRLAQDGYGETIRSYQQVLATWCDVQQDGQREKERLAKLVEQAYQFDNEAAGVRTRQFIARIETTKAESPTAAKIKVMSVHKSKGLEFDIVVLPDLDDKLVKQNPAIIVSRANPAAPIDFVTRYAGKELLETLPTDYQNAFAAWRRNEVIEALDVLYVAVTRAKQELVMLVPKNTKKGGKTYRGILVNALEKNPTHGDPDWTLASGQTADAGIITDAKIVPVSVTGSTTKRHLQRKKPSGEERVDTDITITQAAPQAKAALRGTALHQCFEYVLQKRAWLDDYVPGKDELIQNVKNKETAELDWNEVTDAFITACGKPNVRQLLSRSNYADDEDIAVESERRFLVRLDDNLWKGAIDRLVIRRRNGKVAALEVIDFKSDTVERTQQYAPQLEAYRQALAKLYKIDAAKITAKLLYISLDKIVSL